MFEDTKILAAGPEEELEKALQALTAQGILKTGETFEEIDAKRAIVIPGLVNTHCHLGMIRSAASGDDCKDRLRVFLLPMENQPWTRRWPAFHAIRHRRAAALRCDDSA